MLHDKVIEQWGTEIVAGVRVAGESVTADQVAARFGVSRTVVREAVRVLESLGLITVRPHVGITVTPPDRWTALDDRVVRWRLAGPDAQDQLADLQQLRSVAEPLAAQLTAGCASVADRQALTRTVVAMADAERAGDLSRFALQDAHFHQILLQAAGNPLLAGLAPLVALAIAADDPALTGHARCRPADLMRHVAVAAAIQAGDADEAGAVVTALVRDHLRRSTGAASLAGDRRVA